MQKRPIILSIRLTEATQYMYLTSKCRGELDLGLCSTLALTNRMPLRGGDFRFKNVVGRKICRDLTIRDGVLFASCATSYPSFHCELCYNLRCTKL